MKTQKSLHHFQDHAEGLTPKQMQHILGGYISRWTEKIVCNGYTYLNLMAQEFKYNGILYVPYGEAYIESTSELLPVEY